MTEKYHLLRSFQNVVTAHALVAEIYEHSSVADEFLELFTLQFIVNRLEEDELIAFSQLLEKHTDGELLKWIQQVIPDFEKRYVIELKDYLDTVH